MVEVIKLSAIWIAAKKSKYRSKEKYNKID